MSSSATGSDAGLLFSTSALSGAGDVTIKSSSGVEVETPGLQGVVSGRVFGSTISRGTDSKGGVFRRFEARNKSETCRRYDLTEYVEQLEEVREDFGECFIMPPPTIIEFRDLFERAWRWGWERFFPVDNPRYLEEFYWRNVKASGAQSETTLGQQPTICATAGVNLVYLRRKKDAGSTQSDATTGQQHANSACANHNLACADHNLSDAITGQQHADSACANHDLACADHNLSDATTGQQHANSAYANHDLAIADHNLAMILVYLCCKKESEMVSKWKKKRSKWKKKQSSYSQEKMMKEKGLCFLSPEIRLSTRIQKEITSLVLPTEKTPIPIIPPVIYDCINCITKEAELILEWLRLGFGFCGFQHDLSHDIRKQVLCLIKKYSRADQCSASVATCAVLLGITTESKLVCKKLRQDNDILGLENNLSTEIRTSALDMLASDMDVYMLKMARTDGFCYKIHFDPASADIRTWHEREWRHSNPQDTELGKVHIDGAHELTKENHATKNKEEDVTVNGITRGAHELSKESHSIKNKLEKDVTANDITRESQELSKEIHSTKNKLEEDVTINGITRGSQELSKENHSTKNKLEKDVTVNGITRSSHELSKENHSTKNKLEKDVTVNGITRGSHELSNENHSTKNKPEEDVTVNGITRGSQEFIKENYSAKNKLEEDVTVSGITTAPHE